MEILEWYNFIFVLPIGLAAIYLILSATGLAGSHDVGTDADVSVDHDVDLGMDHDVDVGMDHDVDLGMDHDVDVGMDHDVEVGMDHDVDVGMDHDVEVAADHDVSMEHDVAAGHDVAMGHGDLHGVEHEVHEAHIGAGHDYSLMLRALSVLGFGKVPVSILVIILLVMFGTIGLMCNGLFGAVLGTGWAPNVYVWLSLAIAVVGSMSLTGSLARVLHRVMPTSETYAIHPRDLVGRTGLAVYPLSEGRKGVVDVKDEGGTLHRIAAMPVEGAITKNTEVVVVRYHKEGDYYDVSVSPL